MSFIPADQYAQIIEVLPIMCVDVVIQNPKGEYLLVKRVNEPLKAQWWVIGGRVQKGETLEHAVIRKLKEETGLEAERIQPIGYYEDIFDSNPFGLKTKLHCVSIVFLVTFNDRQEIKLDHQSSDWKYFKELPNDFRVKSFIKGE